MEFTRESLITKKVFISHSWKCIAKYKANEKCFCLSIVMFCPRFFCWGCSSNCIKYINVDDIKKCNKILCGFYYPYECIELFLALFRLSLLSSVSSINALCLLLLLYVPDKDLWFYIKAKINGTNGGINNFMTSSIHINILHFGQIFTLLLLGLSIDRFKYQKEHSKKLIFEVWITIQQFMHDMEWRWRGSF